MMFWVINNLQTVKYSVHKRVKLKRSGIVNRFKRGGSKKIIKKTQSTSLLRVIQLNFLFNTLTNTPPLSTLLNLIGINVQKFCEELNKEVSGLFFLNVLIKLRIFVLKNLSFNYTINPDINFLIKNVLVQESSIGVFTLNYITDKSNLNLERLTNTMLSVKIFTNLLFFRLTFLIYFLNVYIFKLNCYKSAYTSFFQLFYLNYSFEAIVRNNYSILKSYNLKNLKISIL
jgi:hypothetical protein